MAEQANQIQAMAAIVENSVKDALFQNQGGLEGTGLVWVGLAAAPAAFKQMSGVKGSPEFRENKRLSSSCIWHQ